MSDSPRPVVRFLVSVVLIVLLLALGAGAGQWLYSLREEPPRKLVESLPPVVEAVTIRAGDVVERFTAYGSARPDRMATLSAEVSSVVRELPEGLSNGSPVAEGQAIVRLDDRQYAGDLEGALAQADAQRAIIEQLDVEGRKLARLLDIASAELRIAADEQSRVTALFEREDAQKREYDLVRLAYQQMRRTVETYEKDIEMLGPRKAQADAARRSFEAAAEVARLNVERCLIKAPFAGTIDRMEVELGDRVGPGSALVTLVDSTHVEVSIRLPTSLADEVRAGAPCRLEAESGGVTWEGTIDRVAPMAEETLRTFTVYVDVDNTRQLRPLLPGAFVRAIVDGPVHRGGLLVPREAVRRGRVLVVEVDRIRLRPVTVERFLGESALVSGSLRDGECVVLSHLETLADGAPVRVRLVPPGAAATPPAVVAAPGGTEVTP